MPSMKDLVLECAYYEYSQEYFNLYRESMELNLLLHQLYVSEHVDQISPYYMESGYFMEADTNKESLKTKIGEKLKKFSEGFHKVMKRIFDAIIKLLKRIKSVFSSEHYKYMEDRKNHIKLTAEQIKQILSISLERSKLSLTNKSLERLYGEKTFAQLKTKIMIHTIAATSRDQNPKACSLSQLNEIFIDIKAFQDGHDNDNRAKQALDKIHRFWDTNHTNGVVLFNLNASKDPATEIDDLIREMNDKINRSSSKIVPNIKLNVEYPFNVSFSASRNNASKNCTELSAELSQVAVQSIQIYAQYIKFSETVLIEAEKLLKRDDDTDETYNKPKKDSSMNESNDPMEEMSHILDSVIY